MVERIAAIVISHDRIAEIQGSIAALRGQTRRPDALIVVDNASADGSLEWLDAQADVRTLRQGNLGASGGIRTGLAYALAQGFDWCWLFDDDAHPAPGALAALCQAMRLRPGARVLNSIGLSRTDPTRFAVGALWIRTTAGNYLEGHKAETLAEAQPYVDANGMVDSIGGHFYQGVLLHRSVIESVGAPLPWLYMCGEEIEYGLRIMRAGHHIFSVMGSIVYHPAIPFVSLQVLGWTKPFEIRGPQRRYYFIRNSVWTRRNYFPQSPFLPYVARRLGGALLAELFVIPDRSVRERLIGCAAALQGTWDGFRLKPARDANGKEILA